MGMKKYKIQLNNPSATVYEYDSAQEAIDAVKKMNKFFKDFGLEIRAKRLKP